MKRNDLIAVCTQNLFRRKSRTLLTVLGVVVGCCAIMIMVSLGVGMKESQEKMLAEMGDLTIITVYPGGSKKIGNDVIEAISKINGVETVSPKDNLGNIPVKLYAGPNRRYQCDYIETAALNANTVEQLGYRLVEGEMFSKKPFFVLVGEDFAYGFADTKRPEGRNYISPYGAMGDGMMMVGDGSDLTTAEKPTPYFDPMKTKLTLELEVGDTGKKITQELVVAGRMKEDYGKGFETSQGLVLRSEDLNQLLEAYRRAAGSALKKKEYPSALVKVSGIQQVAEVEEQIKSLGYRTSSMESIRQPMEKEARQKQMMLGGLGAISLLVASIGITNTMIMSISERTREIGVMKSLGCYVRDIRSVFLMEAGCIGLLGGAVGTVISLVASVIMNLLSAQQPFFSFSDAILFLFTPGGRMSVIPLWLVVFSLLFSAFIGLGSGYYPASKAVKISALEAIKHD